MKNNLSRHLARVRRGGELVVYDRDTPIARVVPFTAPSAADAAATPDQAGAAAHLADLARQGIISPGEPQALADWLGRHRPVKRPGRAASAVKLLLDERRASRR